jgi:hypothetical protein
LRAPTRRRTGRFAEEAGRTLHPRPRHATTSAAVPADERSRAARLMDDLAVIGQQDAR